MPCKQKGYVQTLKYYHKTSWDYKAYSASSFTILIAYNSLEVKTKIETLIYDSVDVLAAAGGNLGLFLGFSCLGCIWFILEHLQPYFGRD